MPTSKKSRARPHISHLRGVAQLATEATAGVTRIVEGVHQSVWSTLGFPAGATASQTRGITGLVFKTIQSITQLVGSSADAALALLQPLLETAEAAPAGNAQRQALLAALNGVMGDHLAASGNPFAIPMRMHYRGETHDRQKLTAMPGANGKVLLMIHGLCMNHRQWLAMHNEQPIDHGQSLAAALGYTPVYLHYNSGMHISTNARALSAQLTELCAQWPTPIEELSVVAHSMGGLIMRGALHYAVKENLSWPRHLRKIVFLGTPHHGAPLERAGNWVDTILGSTPYSRPFAKLGQLRSAGITDLRYGYVLDEDWQGTDRFARQPDRRIHLPLPENVACYSIAATSAPKRGLLADRLFGDGLVPLRSALGQHDNPKRALRFAKNNQWIAYRTGHLQLLRSLEVGQQMLHWLG
jgi:pimeloyl-ACP methyl ester carboxylesterase